MKPFLPSFALQETQGLAPLQAISESAAFTFEKEQQSCLVLHYPESSYKQAHIVGRLIRAIVYCSQKNIPLLLNRTGEQLDLPNLSEGFCIGLQTSGTTGKPKWVFSDFANLLPIPNTDKAKQSKNQSLRWLLCYHPFSYAGLQVILQTLVGGNTLCAFPHLSVRELAEAALHSNITAISCTPSLFRSLHLSWGKNKPALQRLSLGGEIASQSILDEAKESFPKACLRHIYATTESGVLFSVKDGQAGFPASWIGQAFKAWALSIEDEYLVLTKPEQRIDTGDRIAIDNERCQFMGRSDNIINVGGSKVDALEIETQILQLEAVIDARVFAKKNPIVGNLVCVEIASHKKSLSEHAIKQWMQQQPRLQQPRLIKWVDHISLSDTGKKLRIEQ